MNSTILIPTKEGVTVVNVTWTPEEYTQHVKDMRARYLVSLKHRMTEWKAKKGYSPKMDAWCEVNIIKCRGLLINELRKDLKIQSEVKQ